MSEFKVHCYKDAVVVSHVMPRRTQHFSFRIYDGRQKVYLNRLKYSLKRSPSTITIDKLYRLGQTYNITPVSVQNPLHSKQKRYNKTKVLF